MRVRVNIRMSVRRRGCQKGRGVGRVRRRVGLGRGWGKEGKEKKGMDRDQGRGGRMGTGRVSKGIGGR